MKQKFSLPLAKRLLLAPATVLLVLGGCQASVVDYQVQNFANIRVMNFAQLPAVNMDVYWYIEGTTRPTLVQANAQAIDLRYGAGAVYTTGIPASPGGTLYHYIACVTTTQKIDVEGTMLIYPADPVGNTHSGKYTLIITTNPWPTFTARAIEDDVQPAGADTAKHPAYVRFINMQPGSPKLSVRVNDAVNGDVIDMVNGTHGVDFNYSSDYVPLTTVTDTSFSFFVTQTGSGNALPLARLSDQTFTAKNYYTLIYAGDPARMPRDTEAIDTAQAPLDNYRLRAFDDNYIGNDQSAPLQPAFRYNIVNGLVPTSNGYFNGFTKLGFTVNGENLRGHNNFTFWPVNPLTPAGSGYVQPGLPSDSIWEVHFASTSIPIHKIGISASATDDNGKNAHLMFDLNDNNKLGFDETKIKSDTAISFVFVQADSTLKNPPGLIGIGIPNYSYSDSVILILVSDVQLPVGSARYTNFYTTIPNVPGDTAYKGLPPGNSKILIVPATSTPIVISTTIGLGNKAVPGATKSFAVLAGGIYEVVSVGTQTNSSILVMHLNGK